MGAIVSLLTALAVASIIVFGAVHSSRWRDGSLATQKQSAFEVAAGLKATATAWPARADPCAVLRLTQGVKLSLANYFDANSAAIADQAQAQLSGFDCDGPHASATPASTGPAKR